MFMHGNSNLWRHYRNKCKGRVRESQPTSSSLPQPQPQLLPSGPGESSAVRPAAGMQEEEASRDLARMIVLGGYDPSVVEDDYFRSFVRRLNPEFKLPSRQDMEKMCSDVFDDYRRYLVYLLEDDDTRKVSLAVGQSKTIVYVTIHFIDDHWNLHRVVNNVSLTLPVDDYYHVPLPRVYVVNSLDCAVDCIMFDTSYICEIHEVFMIAGEMTGHINHLELKNHMEKGFGFNPIYSTTYMDHVLHSIARCLLPETGFAKEIFDDIDELRCDSSLLRKHPKLLTQLGLLDDPWEYNERWYSCYCSLKILLHIFPDKYSDDSTELLLCNLWRKIYRAIKRVCDSSCPTSNLCLQELFKVRDDLQSQLSKALPAALSDNYSGFGDKNVADVLREALDKVNKAIQDSYLVWSVPLVLDPLYKLKYIEFSFKRVFSSEAADHYVSKVTAMIKKLYADDYVKEYSTITAADHSDSDSANATTTRVHPWEQAWNEHCHSQENLTTEFNICYQETQTELDRYLQDSLVLVPATEDFDVLKWWKVHSSEYPTVARMARDALAMPTCSKLASDQIALVRSMLRGCHQAMVGK